MATRQRRGEYFAYYEPENRHENQFQKQVTTTACRRDEDCRLPLGGFAAISNPQPDTIATNHCHNRSYTSPPPHHDAVAAPC